MAGMSSASLTVCTFESRRRDEMALLIEKSGGVPINAPSMREITLGDNPAVVAFAESLAAGRLDHVLFMTGVGTNALFGALEELNLKPAVLEHLATRTIIARGPKPVAALNKLGIRVDIKAPEPNTWREVASQLLAAGVPLAGRSIAVQEYGEPSLELYDWLREQGAHVERVPVYKWGLPDDLAPLQAAIHRTIRGELDVLLWTSAQQINHTLGTAEDLGCREAWLQAANRCVIGSIGPTASQRLRDFGLLPDLEPTHPKMAHLVRETLAAAPAVLQRKRGVG